MYYCFLQYALKLAYLTKMFLLKPFFKIKIKTIPLKPSYP